MPRNQISPRTCLRNEKKRYGSEASWRHQVWRASRKWGLLTERCRRKSTLRHAESEDKTPYTNQQTSIVHHGTKRNNWQVSVSNRFHMLR